MTTANENLRDSFIRHQIGLLRLSRRLSREVIEILNNTDAQIRNEVEIALLAIAGSRVDVRSPRNAAALVRLSDALREIRRPAAQSMLQRWTEELRALTASEVAFMTTALQTVSPVSLDLNRPDGRSLRAIPTSNPFEGRTLRQWAERMVTADIDRMMTAISTGLALGEDNRTIARRVVGTVRRRGRDGVTQVTRRNAEAITRTATNHVANQARLQMMLANSDILSEELYVATLDGRTTAICRSLDGEIFALGEGPRPPLHFGCRSLRVPVIDAEVIGQRPARPATEARLLTEYAEQNRLVGAFGSRNALPRGHKTAFDRFRQRRLRELTGRVPARVNYEEWLGTQSRQFQDDVLGRTRGRLFRRGELSLDRFVDRNGREFTLDELARTDAAAFRAAGLDPSDFLDRRAA